MSGLYIDKAAIMEENRPGGKGMISREDFKKRLKDAKINQKVVSETLGHDKSWLSRKISGARKMKCEELVKICELTGMSPHDLLGWARPEGKPTGKDEDIFKEFLRDLTPRQLELFAQLIEVQRSRK